ncbi:hypothetical protein R3P38DRAFT_2634106 [Favolaschia claudopus]|uniref:F-box domain-containing protein n=1 Tax=Favolaschia claudopus TaxID=2862362 RepID=A0AAW0AXU7_9AGAR
MLSDSLQPQPESTKPNQAVGEAEIADLGVNFSGLQVKDASPRLEAEGGELPFTIQALPLELIAEIFVAFLSPFPESSPSSGILSPILLCRICRRWREIALSTPTLWRAISLVVDDFDGPDNHNAEKLELLGYWMQRSRTQPLSLKLASSTSSQVVVPFIEAIVAHCHRWEYLDLLVPFDCLLLLQGEMPLLRELTVGPVDLRHDITRGVKLFGNAPQLWHITLRSCFLNSTLRFPWSQITHLDAHCLYEHECTDILRETPLLVACTLCVCCSDDDMVVGPAVPVLPQLQTLILLSQDLDVRLWLVLDYLTLPALQTLEVAEPCITLVSLATLAERSKCHLNELLVTEATRVESAYRDVFPGIQTIRLDGRMMQD